MKPLPGRGKSGSARGCKNAFRWFCSQRAKCHRSWASLQSSLQMSPKVETKCSMAQTHNIFVFSRVPLFKRNHIFLRRTLVLVDATVYPANAQYLNQALNSMATILHFGGHCVGHCQFPVMQSNTTSKAWTSHRRSMEDCFVNNNLDVTNSVTLHFQKPTDSQANDKRRLVQQCLALSSDAEKLLWTIPPVISNIPLIKVADMKGYEEGSKPSPGARAEQQLGMFHS